MLNLLFIVGNSKAGAIKSHLQPRLKAKIDVVADFDHGLKDVFEKRPTVVVIQEQIAGVSGDSVARHIQMLLGSGAPTFILAHEGNAGAKVVRGLFEHLVDLDKSETEFFDDILSVLTIILGDKAESLIIAPEAGLSGNPATGAAKQKKDVADELIDDFLTEIEKIESSGVVFEGQEHAAPEPLPGGHVVPVVSTTDEMASMLIDAARQAKEEPAPAPTRPAPETGKQAAAVKPVAVTPPPKTAAEPSAAAKPIKAADAVPEDLLQAFEKNYNSCAASWKKRVGMGVAIAVVAALGGGVWYLGARKPGLFSFGGGNATPGTPKPANAPAPQAVVKTAAPQPEPGKTADAAAGKGAGVEKAAVAPQAAPMPAFIQSARSDAAYSAQKPGWERFLGKEHDIRIFRADNRIKAVQVIAVKNGAVSEKFLKSVLNEVVGGNDYSLGKRETKEGYRGYLLQRGTMNGKADLVLYRSKKNDTIAAFVVSLN